MSLTDSITSLANLQAVTGPRVSPGSVGALRGKEENGDYDGNGDDNGGDDDSDDHQFIALIEPMLIKNMLPKCFQLHFAIKRNFTQSTLRLELLKQ